MKHFAICVCVTMGWAGAVDAQITDVGSARTVSLFLGIKHYCRSRLQFRPEAVEAYANAATEVGRKLAGDSRWRQIIVREGARRQKEIEITGPAKWCDDQRRYLIETTNDTLPK